MTPEQALAFLDRILAGVSLSREGHSQVLQAMQILQQALPKDRGEPPIEM